MTNLHIRKATLFDLNTLLEFEQGLITAELPMDEQIITSETVHYYDISYFIEAEDIQLLVAETGDGIIGCGYGRIMENPVWCKEKQYGYVGFMFVKDAYRGQGISNLIIDDLCKWFKTQAIREVRLRVYEKNPGAIKSYKRSGFEEHRKEMRLMIE